MKGVLHMALRVLVTDGMDAGAMEQLRKDGYEVVEQNSQCHIDMTPFMHFRHTPGVPTSENPKTPIGGQAAPANRKGEAKRQASPE